MLARVGVPCLGMRLATGPSVRGTAGLCIDSSIKAEASDAPSQSQLHLRWLFSSIGRRNLCCIIPLWLLAPCKPQVRAGAKLTCCCLLVQLPVYVPNAEEAKDPRLYARNVRAAMMRFGGFGPSESNLQVG